MTTYISNISNKSNKMYKYTTTTTTTNVSTASGNIITIVGQGHHPITADTTHLFNDDVFVIDESNKVCIITSPTRSAIEIPAVLCLRGNRTYGRQGNRHLYKCVPDDKHLPPFLVAYELKHIGFSKIIPNKYVLIKYTSWTSTHPVATLTNAIGDVDVLDNYYEYKLFCHSLALSIQPFVKRVANALIDIVDPTATASPIAMPTKNKRVITIDPAGTRDFDDAFSICMLDDGETCLVSVHIADVPACLDAYGLWDYVSRVSTIYLPNKSKPMLPPRLSEHDCSLVSGKSRPVLTMDTVINATTGTVISVSFSQSRIIVARNYVYEEIELLNTPEYRQLLSVSRAMSATIKDSHELVAFWMTQMNRQMAIKMHDEYHTGIFRRATLLDNDVLPPEVKHWRNAVCDYVAIHGDDGIATTTTTTTTLHHELMGLDKYLHITSPIRRLVDLINMTLFQLRTGVRLTVGATNFCRGWMERLDYINDRMKATRRVQTECSLLALCSSDIECDGYLYNKRNTSTTGVNIFSVYLKSLNLTYILKTIDTDVENGDTRRFKVVVFSDEDCFKRKIRLIRIK